MVSREGVVGGGKGPQHCIMQPCNQDFVLSGVTAVPGAVVGGKEG